MPTATRALLLFCIGLCCALAPMGCTNDTSLTTGAVTRAVTFSIEWGDALPSNSGAIQAPSKAKFARLTLLDANPYSTGAGDKDLKFDAPRPTTDQDKTITQTYPANRDVKVGPTILVAVFFADAHPADNAVPLGTLSMKQTVSAAPTTIAISTVTPITSVVIATGQRVVVGKSLFIEDTRSEGLPLLVYSARGVDATGQTVPVPLRPGGAAIIVAPEDADRLSLRPDGGQITGIIAGPAHVSVKVTPDVDKPNESKTSDQSEVVTVLSSVRVTIDPAAVTLRVRVDKQQQFNAKVTTDAGNPASIQAVQWKVLEGAGGTIDSSGLYTAPATVGTYHVVATSQQDSTVSVTAEIKVVGGNGSVILQ